MQYWSYIYAIGAAQGFVLAIALLRKKTNVASNQVLAVWMFCMVFDLTMKTIFLNDRSTPLLPLYTLIVFFPFLYGSFFFLYARALTQHRSLSWQDAIHFLGFIFMAGANLHWISDPWHNGPRAFAYFDLSLYLYSVSYVIAGIWVISKYRRYLVEQQSNTEGIELTWVNVMAYGQIVIWLIAVTQWLIPIKAYNVWVIYLAVAVWIILMGYLALSQQNVQPVEPIIKPKEPESDERFPEVDQRLKTLMKEQKLYLKPALSIAELAKVSGYPEYLISLVINRVYQRTFREYINELRINEAKTMLSNGKRNQTILEVAYDCGFTSKSTFNNAFKRFAQETPSAYKQRLLNN